jgi:rubrerythrin
MEKSFGEGEGAMVMCFSPQEILTMAVELEKKGMAFYEELLQRATSSSAKEAFSLLRDEEEKHLEFFSSLLGEIDDRTEFIDTMEEVESYLRAIVEDGVLGKVLRGVGVPSPQADLIEAISFGIEVEKESILFYQGFADFVPQAKMEWLQKVIDEERRHFVYLTALKKEWGGGS